MTKHWQKISLISALVLVLAVVFAFSFFNSTQKPNTESNKIAVKAPEPARPAAPIKVPWPDDPNRFKQQKQEPKEVVIIGRGAKEPKPDDARFSRFAGKARNDKRTEPTNWWDPKLTAKENWKRRTARMERLDPRISTEQLKTTVPGMDKRPPEFKLIKAEGEKIREEMELRIQQGFPNDVQAEEIKKYLQKSKKPSK